MERRAGRNKLWRQMQRASRIEEIYKMLRSQVTREFFRWAKAACGARRTHHHESIEYLENLHFRTGFGNRIVPHLFLLAAYCRTVRRPVPLTVPGTT